MTLCGTHLSENYVEEDVRGGVYLAQLDVNKRKHKLHRNFPAIISGQRKDHKGQDDWEKHLNTYNLC